MPRGTAGSIEDKITKLNEVLDRITKRREARREKFVAADSKDAERERELRAQAVRLQVTADHGKELDAKIAEELARLDGDDADATVPHDEPGKGVLDDAGQERDANGNLVFSH